MQKGTEQTCTRCVLDTTTKFITFDENGVCNFCRDYDAAAKNAINKPREIRAKELEIALKKIKKKGEGKKYDCVIGMSGGLDSSYLAVLVKEWGLRPLVVHFDNGWNTELAVNNINNLVTRLGYDLYTYVIDWEEFKDLQISYFKASVIDIEVPTDQLIFAILYKLAKENGIKYILDGYNFRTEFGMPRDWSAVEKFDLTNLNNIHNKFGKVKLKKFPTISETDLYYNQHIHDIQTMSLINFVEYDWHQVKQLLKDKFEYKPYQYKHYESIFTRFYQGYILPKKFNIDKRKAHLSTLIRSGFITRDAAVKELQMPTYPLIDQEEDKKYVMKKWDMTEKEFDHYMDQPIVSHDEFGYDKIGFLPKLLVRLHYIYLFKIAYPLGIKKRVTVE
jgi:N-acetyl sugar amidotransferase